MTIADDTHCDEAVQRQTARWLQHAVIGLNLCPFASREVEADRLRYKVTPATTESALLQALAEEIERLRGDNSIATSLLIHPRVLQDFDDYNQFLDLAEALLDEAGAVGELQIASFHPHYRFAGTAPDDPGNYSNRSPYPMLHLLREADVARAVDSHPDINAIPERNVERLQQLGLARLDELLARCRDDTL